jgi:hypothetical protein
MPDYEATIDTLVRGNDLDITRTVSVVPTGQTLTDAWLRVDEVSPAGTQIFEKHITSALVAGEGQIEDTGSGDGIAVIRFEITAENSTLLDGGTVAAPAQHPYGIQVKTSGGKIYEFEQGILPVIQQIVTSA